VSKTKLELVDIVKRLCAENAELKSSLNTQASKYRTVIHAEAALWCVQNTMLDYPIRFVRIFDVRNITFAALADSILAGFKEPILVQGLTVTHADVAEALEEFSYVGLPNITTCPENFVYVSSFQQPKIFKVLPDNVKIGAKIFEVFLSKRRLHMETVGEALDETPY
jgi:hypothetical protein